MFAFRVFFEDGSTFDCLAKHPDDAREIAKSRRDGIITKVKRLKE